jgi:lipopolysaccharide biosynthesis glycosyltransferase
MEPQTPIAVPGQPGTLSAATDVVHVVMAADGGFVIPLAVALTSLARAHDPGELAVTILHDGFDDADRERVARSVSGRLDLRWREVSPNDLDGVHYPAFLTPATLFRLLMPELLPAAERVIYLDADTVVTGSLRPLWDIDLGDHLAAAVRDGGTPFAAGPLGTDWRKMGLDPGAPYFNAGLLVVALDAWREAAVGQRVLDVLRTSKPRWADQDALNVVLAGSWMELPRRWNVQTPDVEARSLAWALWRDDVEEALRDPLVIHYTERDKPWDPGCRHPLTHRWFDALDDSAWSEWRPSRPLYRRVASRTKRAWQVLTAPPSAAPSAP